MINMSAVDFTYRTHLCGYDLNLSYPQNGHFPSITPSLPSVLPTAGNNESISKRGLLTAILEERGLSRERAERSKLLLYGQKKRDTRKRFITGNRNRTIDPTYGCNIWDEMVDYALNFSDPWGAS